MAAQEYRAHRGGTFSLGIRAWLLLFSLATTLPLILFSAGMVYETERAQQDAILATLQQRTEAAANAVEQRLGAAASALHTLAQSNAAQTDNLPALYAYAKRLLPLNPDVLSISLIGPDNEQIFNTLKPLGTKLPPSGDPDTARRVFETGRAAVSGVFIGSVSNKPVTTVGVPVRVDGRIKYCLRMVLLAETFNAVLDGQRLPPDWFAAIIDSSGGLVARRVSPEAYVGTKAVPSVLEAVQETLRSGRPGIFETSNKEGTPVKRAVAQVPSWDWVVTIGVATSSLNAPVRQSLLVTAAGGCLVLLAGVAVAWWWSRQIAGKVRLASRATAALATGEAPVLAPTHIRELDALGTSLFAAERILRQREARLKAYREEAEARAAEAEEGQRNLEAMLGRLREGELERDRLLAQVQRQAEVLEVKVGERTRELELKNRELQDFSFVASHDLQEPLRKVRVFGQRLRDDFADVIGDEGRDYVQRMEKAAERMQTLIHDLLEYSRVSTRTTPFESVDLGEVAREALADLDQRLEETGGTIEIGDLPTAEVDAGQLRQVFQNLFSNALKYHGQEVPQVRVSGEAVSEGGREVVRVRVQDNGIGFEEQYLDRIFQPFQRLHGRSEYEGTGIGLAIVRKIVERHKGTITARSEPGQGAAFIIELPRRQAAPQVNSPG